MSNFLTLALNELIARYRSGASMVNYDMAHEVSYPAKFIWAGLEELDEATRGKHHDRIFSSLRAVHAAGFDAATERLIELEKFTGAQNYSAEDKFINWSFENRVATGIYFYLVLTGRFGEVECDIRNENKAIAKYITASA